MARGEARGMIWREGLLPEDAPAFPQILTYDLLSYGYGLLGHGLRLTEAGGSRIISQRAFESAATSIEAAIARGQANSERPFHRVIAAAAYHLATYSARAYSLLRATINNEETTIGERCLALLMLRDLDGLEDLIATVKTAGDGSDAALVEMLRRALEPFEASTPNSSQEVNDIEDVLDLAITDQFVAALSTGMLAFERGERGLLDRAVERLRVGLEGAAEFGLITQWWTHRLAIHLLQGLWGASFHAVLPFGPSDRDGGDWTRLRETLIALLYRRRRAEIDLWPSQIDAALRVLNTTESLVLSLPTSAGKTRIAELCILATLAEGKRVVFVTPLRALSAQTEAALERTFVPLGKTVSSLYGSIGVSEVDEEVLHDRDIIVATPEKLDFALRNDPSLLDDVGLVVLDEGHMIGPNEREVRYEVQIQRLLRRADAGGRRIVCLSAILPEGDKVADFVDWITDGEPNGLVSNEWRPTKLRFGEITWRAEHARLAITVGEEEPFVPRFLNASLPPAGRRRTPFPRNQMELCLASAWQFIEDGQTVLVFCPLRKSVDAYAKAIVDLNRRGALRSILEGDVARLATALTIGEEWFSSEHPILECLRLGVAIHHGSLPTPYRKEVEKLLQLGILRVTISSPTLAQGLNLAASTLIVHSLWRNKEMIKSSEFRNVVGRAGRAYVDLAGLVVHPMFDKIGKRRGEWASLVQDNALPELESGLVLLVMTLLTRMVKANGDDSLESLIEYVAGVAAWDFPEVEGERDDRMIEARAVWPTRLASLDTALLSLLSDNEVSNDDLEQAIDIALSSSLWTRNLARRTATAQAALRIGLVARARFLWSNSTATQRRGYFLAGVGLETGRLLDVNAANLDRLLRSADEAISIGDDPAAIAAITEFAKIVFQMIPFAPKELPKDWQQLLALWLRGEPVIDVSSSDAAGNLEFFEGSLVYRLPWALEAVRVRAAAHQDDNEFPWALIEIRADEGLAVAAVETGALNRSVALLIRAGFASRAGAFAAVSDTGGDFTSTTELYSWLRSEIVRKLGAGADWPTVATHDLWTDFAGRTLVSPQVTWITQTKEAKVRWSSDYRPEDGEALRIGKSTDGSTILETSESEKIGTLAQPLNPSRVGLLLATGVARADLVSLKYCGPADLHLSAVSAGGGVHEA